MCVVIVVVQVIGGTLLIWLPKKYKDGLMDMVEKGMSKTWDAADIHKITKAVQEA